MNNVSQSPLYWDSTYEIVLALMSNYPDVSVDEVGLEQLYQMVVSLPNFGDDHELANEGILNGILREWYEEAIAS